MEEDIKRNEEGIAILTTTHGKEIKVDDDVYRRFQGRSIGFGGQGRYPTVYVQGKMKYIHRIVMNAKDDELVDHKFNDKLDARRASLRIVSASVNSYNRKKPNSEQGRKKYHGVSQKRNRFSVHVTKDYVRYSGGSYESPQIAAWAANQLSTELYGHAALLNDVELEGYVWRNRRAVPGPTLPTEICDEIFQLHRPPKRYKSA